MSHVPEVVALERDPLAGETLLTLDCGCVVRVAEAELEALPPGTSVPDLPTAGVGLLLLYREALRERGLLKGMGYVWGSDLPGDRAAALHARRCPRAAWERLALEDPRPEDVAPALLHG